MPYFLIDMLINKRLLDFNLMIVRRTDKSFLKYIMDLGMNPLVSVTIGKDLCTTFLIYSREYIMSSRIFCEESQLQKIRPLNTQEIKIFLNKCSPNIKKLTIASLWGEDINIVLDNYDFVTLTPIFINRNILCEN